MNIQKIYTVNSYFIIFITLLSLAFIMVSNPLLFNDGVSHRRLILIRVLVVQVLRLLVKVFQKLSSPDYLSICQCLMFLDEPEGVASILERLLRSENKDDALLAFQIAFDLVENEHQAFLLSVRDRLASPKLPSESAQPKPSDTGSTPSASANAPDDVQMEDGDSASIDNVPEDPSEKMYAERLNKIKGILSGETSIQLTLQFLYSHNK